MNMEEPVRDITIIGGGPTGLYAAFCAGFRSMSTRIIDSLDYLGGQLTTLYPDKFIYDVPGFPAVLARTLASELIRQALNYHPVIALGEQVQGISAGGSTIEIITDRTRHLTRSVLVSVGGGSIAPNRWPDPALARFEGRGLEYLLMDISDYRRRRVLVVGGGDAAIDACLLLKRVTDHVILIHRHGRLRGAADDLAFLRAAGVDIRFFHELVALHGDAWVASATLSNHQTRQVETLPVDAVLACIGSTSTCGPIHEWGLTIDPDGIVVSPRMETNLPGVFAAGDIVSYPGKLKLLGTAFSEAAIAVNHAKVFLDPASSVDPGHSTGIVPRQRAAERQRNAIPTNRAGRESDGA